MDRGAWRATVHGVTREWGHNLVTKPHDIVAEAQKVFKRHLWKEEKEGPCISPAKAFCIRYPIKFNKDRDNQNLIGYSHEQFLLDSKSSNSTLLLH